MYSRILKLFNNNNNNNLFCPLQFSFRQNYSTTHALISLTKTIRKYLDEGKFACGIFIDLQKAVVNGWTRYSINGVRDL